MDNILNFPEFTIVNRKVPKVAFYSHLEVNARMKSLFVEKVAQIVWLYKLAPSNLHVADGKEVHEITVFLVKLKSMEDCQKLFIFIDSHLPRHTLFILQYEEKYQLLVNYKRWKDVSLGTFDIVKTFHTEWQTKFSIQLDVASGMDALYESLVRQMATTQILSSEKDLCQAVAKTQEIENIKRSLDSIRKRQTRERQPQKKFTLHQQYLELKKKLEEIRGQ